MALNVYISLSLSLLSFRSVDISNDFYVRLASHLRVKLDSLQRQLQLHDPSALFFTRNFAQAEARTVPRNSDSYVHSAIWRKCTEFTALCLLNDLRA